MSTLNKAIEFVVLSFMSMNLFAGCITPKNLDNNIIFKVLHCAEVDIDDSKFFEHHVYQGVVLKSKVLHQKKRMKKLMKLFYGTDEKKPCESLKPETKWRGKLGMACCDGSPEPPCLLEFSNFVYDLKK